MNVRLALAVALVLGGCTEEGLILAVDLQTDLVPGADFVAVEAELAPEGGAGRTRTFRIAALRGEPYAQRVRVADFEELPPGPYRLTVRLLRVDAEVLVTRVASVLVDASFGVTILATRSCVNVVCGDGQTCASGRCVDPRCTPETPDACGEPACRAPTDCPAPAAACAEAQCVSGECFAVARADAMCMPGFFCQPETSCQPYPDLPDAGLPDGGVDAGFPPDGGVPLDRPSPRSPVHGAHLGHVSVVGGVESVAQSTGRPKFKWSIASDADFYRLQVARDESFTMVVLDVMSMGESWVAEPRGPDVLGDSGKYLWRVAPCNAAGCGAFGDPAYFWLGRAREELDGRFDGVGAVIVGAPGSGQIEAGGVPLARGEVLSFVYSTGSSAFGGPSIATVPAPGDVASEMGSALVAASLTGDPARVWLAAGGPLAFGETGQVTIHAGETLGMPAQTLPGSGPVARYGAALAARDLDGNGSDDLVVGEPGDGSVAGRVVVYWANGAGIDPTRRTVLTSPAGAGDEYAHVVAAIGDVNGDGYDDVAVGAPVHGRAVEGPAGRVYVYYGGRDAPDGSVLSDGSTFVDSPLPETDEEFGAAITGIGDVNHDGFGDVLIGAPGHSTTRGAGSAYLIFGDPAGLGRGRGPIPIRHPDGLAAPVDIRFGEAVSGGGDADGNATSDFVIAAPDEGSGRVYVYRMDGADPVVVPRPFVLSPEVDDPGIRYGACLALTVDRSGDGHADVVVGAPLGLNRGPGGGSRATGYVDVWFGAPGADPAREQTIWGQGAAGDPEFVSRFGETCL